MAFVDVKRYFESAGLGDRVIELEESSATVEKAANAIGCEPRLIAKSLSFWIKGKPVIIVAAGDAKVDNRKFKNLFQEKAKMIPPDEVEAHVGHAPGGVCPFAVKPGVTVYLDVSLKRFEKVYPAAGSGNSAVELTLEELKTHSRFTAWVDVCKDWEENA